MHNNEKSVSFSLSLSFIGLNFFHIFVLVGILFQVACIHIRYNLNTFLHNINIISYSNRSFGCLQIKKTENPVYHDLAEYSAMKQNIHKHTQSLMRSNAMPWSNEWNRNENRQTIFFFFEKSWTKEPSCKNVWVTFICTIAMLGC